MKSYKRQITQRETLNSSSREDITRLAGNDKNFFQRLSNQIDNNRQQEVKTIKKITN